MYSRTTKDASQAHETVMFLSLLATSTPLGSFVYVRASLLSQIINGAFVSTFGIPISTTANVLAFLSWNVIDLAHHSRDTECYSSGKSAFRDNTSVLLTLTCKRFSPVLNVAQANEIESAPALSNVVQRDTECSYTFALIFTANT